MSERVRIALACEDCGARNYHTTRTRKAQKERLSLKKFCKACGKHTLHRETK